MPNTINSLTLICFSSHIFDQSLAVKKTKSRTWHTNFMLYTIWIQISYMEKPTVREDTWNFRTTTFAVVYTCANLLGYGL